MIVKITCYCGLHTSDLKLLITSNPYHVDLCHCSSCRYTTGGLYAAYVPCSLPAINTFAHLTEYKIYGTTSVWFCSGCGSHLYKTQEVDLGIRWSVSVGVLEEHDGVEFVLGRHTCVGETEDGGISDLLPESGGHTVTRYHDTPTSAVLPIGSPRPLPIRPPQEDDKLWARCDCAGVEFYVTRPTTESRTASQPGWPSAFLGPYLHSATFDPAKEMWWLRPLGQEARTKYVAETCACDDCRRGLGFWFPVWAYIPLCNLFQASGAPLVMHAGVGTLKHVESSSKPGVRRSFCSKCGATVFWWKEGQGLIDVAVGILRAEEGARAERWLEWETGVIICKDDAKEKQLTEELLAGMQSFKAMSQR